MNDIIENIQTDEIQDYEAKSTTEIIRDAFEKHRDEQGRFAKENDKTAKLDAGNARNDNSISDAQQQNTEQVYQAKLNGYNKEQKEVLSKLSPDVLKMIDTREDSYHKGNAPLKEKAQFADNISRLLNDDVEYLQRYNVTPEQWIGRFVNIERQLRNGDPMTKLQTLLGIAHDYGIPQEYLNQVSFDPTQHQLRQQNYQLQQQYNNLNHSRQSAEVEQAITEIESFAQSHQHFEALKPTIANLLDKGLAGTLEEAYVMASRLDEGVFSKIQAEQLENQKRLEAEKANQAAKAAKAAAVSVKGGSPSGRSSVPPAANLRDVISQAWDKHIG